LVDQVAHAFKHVVTGNPKLPNYLSAKDVISRPPAYLDVSASWDVSRWDDTVGGVTLDGDRNVDLLAVVKSAVEFLRRQTMPA
jgi:hypothetical protein